ncbi:MAG TPA: GDP-mannose 4,6-dehydratase [Chloroflexota bacterium]|jgi:CDP-glucose 4,6-dehydratase|nr:GDP-mannose 4,6-dehydratase [Chloroflexota bacterium]
MSSFWRDRPVLITGGPGLIGGWLVNRLLDQTASIVCLVRDWVPQSILLSPEVVARVTVVRGDVGDQPLMERILGEYEIDTVFHLAAQTLVPIANRNPVSTFESNIRGTWSVLEACRRSPLVGQIVVASSDKAYGSQAELPYTEETPLQGRHPYDVSKSCADLIAQSYAQTYGLPVVITRCGNFYGGGDLNWNRIVPGTIRSILRNEAPVIRSDGRLVRDYFYAEDGAAAYTLLAERLAENRNLTGQAFNFSNEEPASVLELVERITKVMGSNRKPVILDEAGHEIPKQFLDAQRARDELGWTAKFSLAEGLSRTVSWYRRFLTEELRYAPAV